MRRSQREDVNRVLRELGLANLIDDGLVIEVLNKLDLLEPEARAVAENQAARDPHLVPLSAWSGEGIDGLLQAIDARLGARRKVEEFALSSSDGAALAWLYRNGQVLARADDAEGIRLKVSLAPADSARFAHFRRQGG